MCVTRPSVRATRRSRLTRSIQSTNNESSTSSENSWSKLANSNFRSTLFENRVHVWVLPLSLSQSKYGGREVPSSACTLITVQMAYDFLSANVRLPSVKPLESQNLALGILEVLINAIVDCNETHEKAMNMRKRGFNGSLKKKTLEDRNVSDSISMFQFLKKPHRDTFTVPEAILVQRPEMHEVDYRCYSGDFISNLVTAMTMVVTSPYLHRMSRLAIGVLAFERAMCFVYDRPTNSILLLDTHMHFKGRAGSIICVASFEDITDFIVGITKLVFQEVFRTPDVSGQFEITCLMLTSLMNKVHRGQIFKTIRSNPVRINSSSLSVVTRKRKRTQIVVPTDEDSGYESNEEEVVAKKTSIPSIEKIFE